MKEIVKLLELLKQKQKQEHPKLLLNNLLKAAFCREEMPSLASAAV